MKISVNSAQSPSVTIRMATARDAGELLAIYKPYVEKTAITFEYQVPDIEDFRHRIVRTLERYPYLTALYQGQIAGYAYASPFKSRAAYDWSVETSIYVDETLHGHGIGKGLYLALEDILKQQNILNLNACIAYPNPESIAFHQAMGYRMAAHFIKCGYKLGKWYDMVWMEKHLGEHPEIPKAVIPIKEL